MKKIAVLVPCFNESLTIEAVVKDFHKALPEADIYVYDNNSKDGTDVIARNAGAIVRYETRQGKGNVVRTMFREIDADCYLMIDGDNAFSAEYARAMCDQILSNKVDVVIGDRLSGNYFTENTRRFHGIGNTLVRYLINKIFSANVNDIMTGYRALSRSFVKYFPVISQGFEIETEMTIHALDKNYRLSSIPIRVKERPEGSVSTLNTFTDGLKVLRTVFRLFMEYKPFLFFSVIAIIFIIISALFFYPVFIEYLATSKVPRFPTLIVCGLFSLLGFMFFFCGLVLDVISKKDRKTFEILMNIGENVQRYNKQSLD